MKVTISVFSRLLIILGDCAIVTGIVIGVLGLSLFIHPLLWIIIGAALIVLGGLIVSKE